MLGLLADSPETHPQGRYQLLARLASGGQADIYLAKLSGPAGFQKLVVIKRLLTQHESDERFREQLRQEAALVARLHHPNVCQAIELIADDSSDSIVFEYLKGIPLSRLIRNLPEPRTADDLRLVVGVLQQACEGLHGAHEMTDDQGAPANLVHRDVSPGNIFVTVDGIVKVLDFGIARSRWYQGAVQKGFVQGTCAYMSPEQARGENLDRRSDVFSLGILAYESVLGLGLFRRDTNQATLQAVLTDEPAPLPNTYALVSETLSKVIQRALQKKRGDRYATAKEFGDALCESIHSLGGPLILSSIAARVRKDFASDIAGNNAQLAAIASDPKQAVSLVTHTLQHSEALPTVTVHSAQWNSEDLAQLPALSMPTSFLGNLTAPATPTAKATHTRSRRIWFAMIVGTGSLLLVWTMIQTFGRAEPTPEAQKENLVAPVVKQSLAPSTPPLVSPPKPSPPEPSPPKPSPPVAVNPTPKGNKLGSSSKPKAAPSTKSFGFVTLDSRPAAEVFFGAQSLGETPLHSAKLPTGTHKLRIVYTDGKSDTLRLQITNDGHIRRRLRWEKQ